MKDDLRNRHVKQVFDTHQARPQDEIGSSVYSSVITVKVGRLDSKCQFAHGFSWLCRFRYVRLPYKRFCRTEILAQFLNLL
jgi:hypothetical protein